MVAKAEGDPEAKAKTWDRRPVVQREGLAERKVVYTTRILPRTKAGLLELAGDWGCNMNDAIDRLVHEAIKRRNRRSV